MASPRDRPDVEVFAEIGSIERLAANSLERVLPAGLSAAGFAVLNHLARSGGETSPLQLARALQVTKGAMTNTLQRLETRSLVRISGDPHDGRRKRVEITPEGVAALRDSLAAARPQMERVRAAFSASQFAAALPFLKRLRALLEERR